MFNLISIMDIINIMQKSIPTIIRMQMLHILSTCYTEGKSLIVTIFIQLPPVILFMILRITNNLNSINVINTIHRICKFPYIIIDIANIFSILIHILIL